MVIKEGISFMTCKLFVCLHKHCFTPTNDIIVPIHAGKALNAVDLGIIGDNTGDNISEKNPYFCELTATYWIWKNVKTDIVGLMHYRRFFNFGNKEKKFHKFSPDFLQKYGLDEQKISQVLENYGLILPPKTKPIKYSVYDYYKKEHIITDLDITLEIIKEKYPDIYDTANDMFKKNSCMYCWNMLACRKSVFDRYADWLFSILFELEKRIGADVVNRDSYQRRVYGFIAERLTAVFVAANPDLRVKEFPVLYWEDDWRRYLKYKIKMAKRKILTFLGLGKEKWKE